MDLYTLTHPHSPPPLKGRGTIKFKIYIKNQREPQFPLKLPPPEGCKPPLGHSPFLRRGTLSPARTRNARARARAAPAQPATPEGTPRQTRCDQVSEGRMPRARSLKSRPTVSDGVSKTRKILKARREEEFRIGGIHLRLNKTLPATPVIDLSKSPSKDAVPSIARAATTRPEP